MTERLLQRRRYLPKLPDFLSLCERNYAMLRRLMPAEAKVGQRRDIRISAGQLYRIEIMAAAPFTTRLQIVLHQGAERYFQPRLEVQLYHDARLAEVVVAQQQRQFKPVYAYPNPLMRQPDEKRQINQLLRDWLQLCLAQGYSAEPQVYSL